MSKFPSQSSENPACDCQNNLLFESNSSQGQLGNEADAATSRTESPQGQLVDGKTDAMHERIKDPLVECEERGHEVWGDTINEVYPLGSFCIVNHSKRVYHSETMEAPKDSNVEGDKWEYLFGGSEDGSLRCSQSPTLPCVSGHDVEGKSALDLNEFKEVLEETQMTPREKQSRQTRLALETQMGVTRNMLEYMSQVLAKVGTERHFGPLSVHIDDTEILESNEAGHGTALVKLRPYIYILSGGPRIVHGAEIRRGDKILCVDGWRYLVGLVLDADVKESEHGPISTESLEKGSTMVRVHFDRYVPSIVKIMDVCEYTASGYTPVLNVGDMLIPRETWPEMIRGVFDLMT